MMILKLKFAASVGISVVLGGGLVTVALARDEARPPAPVASTRVEHSTQLRGIINLPELQVALVEVKHSLLNSNRPPTIFITTRLVKTGETFVDQTIKGHHVQFEIIEINMATQTLKLREDGKDIVCGFQNGDSPAAKSSHSLSGKFGVRLQKVRFEDAMNLYSDLKDRTLLIHPAVVGSPVSLEALASDKSELIDLLEKDFLKKNIATVSDGEKFALLTPPNVKTTPHSQELDANSPIFGSVLCNGPLGALVNMYAVLLGRAQKGSEQAIGKQVYLRTKELSKAEMSYAYDTLLGWSGFKLVVVDDKTFKVVHVPNE